MKLHYFDQNVADADDALLGMAKMQGYVNEFCLLGGATVMDEINQCKDPCWGCNGPRIKCNGNPKKDEEQEHDKGVNG